MKIGIPDDYMDGVRRLECFSLLEGHEVAVWTDAEHDPAVLAKRFADIEALVLLRERTPLPAALIERLPDLRMITLNGPYPHVDLDACTRAGVALCSNKGRLSLATVELTWGLIIAAMRRIPQEAARLKAGKWHGSLGTALRGRKLGVFGYGRIGKEVARIGRAFGMEIVVWSGERSRAAAREEGFEVPERREDFFRTADVVTLHVRLLPETRGVVRAEDLALMKPTAVLVNTARAGLIEEGALAAALKAGRPGAAAVDVYETEPVLNADHPLIALDNAICTPHLGYFERDQIEAYFADQFRRVLAFAEGRPIDVVNPEVLAGGGGR